MGIRGFNKFLAKNCPRALVRGALANFRGDVLAIDATGWMGVAFRAALANASAHVDILAEDARPEDIRETYLRTLRVFLRRLFEAGVIPLFIFDGKAPAAKDATRAERRQREATAATRLQEMRRLYTQGLPESQEVVRQAQALYVQAHRPGEEDNGHLRRVLDALAIPHCIAQREAEELCAALCRSGVARVAYSIDSDTIVHGASLVLNKIHDDGTYDGIDRSIVLADLKLTEAQLTDICVMAGCDYNKNVRGIGIERARRIIEKGDTIESWGKGRDVSCLRHEEVREIFRPKTLREMGWEPRILTLASERIDKGALNAMGLSFWIGDFTDLYIEMAHRADERIPPQIEIILV